MCFFDFLGRIAPSLIASFTALYIAQRVYLRQKFIDRQTAAGAEMRKAHADFLASFETIRDRWSNPVDLHRSAEEQEDRRRIFTQLQWLSIYAEGSSASSAQALFNADEDEAFARRRMIMAAKSSRGNSLAYEKAEQDASDASTAIRSHLRNYLDAIRAEHTAHLGVGDARRSDMAPAVSKALESLKTKLISIKNQIQKPPHR